MCNFIPSIKARRSRFRITVGDSDNDLLIGITGLFKKQNGVTKIAGAKTKEGLYKAAIKTLFIKKYCKVKSDQSDILYRRLGQVSEDIVDSILSQCHGVSLKNVSNNLFFCNACRLGKSVRQPRSF